jgi:hypothetical protein
MRIERRSEFWGAQAASLPFAAACREHLAALIQNTWLGLLERAAQSIRQAAGWCRLAACAPQNREIARKQ